ncbi:hypothetical protein [Aquirhabdus parva]|uniref:hypothetical protein n=1 Tax=Aquirhabdus parva TaxID=2283318 RepID=UPI0013B3FA77|nr:hypothetical protein [Aquirhabdus parva]
MDPILATNSCATHVAAVMWSIGKIEFLSPAFRPILIVMLALQPPIDRNVQIGRACLTFHYPD